MTNAFQPSQGSSPEVLVSSVSVEIADEQATSQMLATIPYSGPIRQHLSRALIFHHWDEFTGRAFWVAGDGRRLRCVTAAGLNPGEMGVIVNSDSYGAARAAFALSPQIISAIIEAEMDLEVRLVN